MTDSTTYVSPLKWLACHLNAKAPLGLFRSTNGGLMWIVQTDEVKGAIFLEPTRGVENFQFWNLADDDKAWPGSSFGAVELEVDWESINKPENDDFGVLHFSRNGMALVVRGPRPIDRYHITVSATAKGETTAPDMCFTQWRLVQRDENGKPIVMYERRAPT